MGLFDAKGEGSAPRRLRRQGGDALQLVIDYVKQETLEPLKGLGRFMVFGVAGSVALCAGLVLLLVAGLRALQEETGTTFAGNLSWLPYVIVAAGALLLIGGAAARIARGPARRRREKHEEGRG